MSVDHDHHDDELRTVLAEGARVVRDLRAQVMFLQTSDAIGRRIISAMLPNVGDSFSTVIPADDEIAQAMIAGTTTPVTLTITKVENDGLDLEVTNDA